ncbi:hypothetical protein AGENTSMITH_13 [Bacillus phage vB_BspM_AgentSmith]|nr:hypothetical protein AGENTSMITH_13 [Bacillus phage vB_BspM_AgentSmith]
MVDIGLFYSYIYSKYTSTVFLQCYYLVVHTVHYNWRTKMYSELNILRDSKRFDVGNFIKKKSLEKQSGENFTFGSVTIDCDLRKGLDDLTISTVTYTEGNQVNVYLLDGYLPENNSKLDLIQTVSKLKPNHGYKIEIVITNSELSLLQLLFKKLQTVEVDFISSWNLQFLVDKTTDTLDNLKKEPGELFDDNLYHKWSIKERNPRDGARLLAPHQRWIELAFDNRSLMLCSMQVYSQLRSHLTLDSYSISNVLKKESVSSGDFTGYGKVDTKTGINWHIEMQEQYPLDYLAIHVVDAIDESNLNKHTQDFSVNLPNLYLKED